MFSELLKSLRAKNSVTQTQLAHAIGVSSGNVGDWERGRSKPGFDALLALARFFEVSTDYLMSHNQSPDVNTSNEYNQLQNPNNNDDSLDLSIEEQLLIQKFRAGIRPLLDEKTKQLTGDTGRLNDVELDLILKFRALDDRDQEDLLDSVNSKYRRSFSSKKSPTSQNGKGYTANNSGAKMA